MTALSLPADAVPRRLLSMAIFAVAAAVVNPAAAAAQEEYATLASLEVTTESEMAAERFWSGIENFENIFFLSGAGHMQAALEADAEFGLAHVLYGRWAPGLTGTERLEMISKGIAMMNDASTAEVLFATALKEWQAGNIEEAKAAVQAAASMVPGDPHVAFYAAWITGIGDNLTAVMAMREVTERFPDFAPPFNLLGYGLFNVGDQEGGLRAIRTYVELLPDHPNPHDSYAELLQRAGRLPMAKAEYEKAIALDPSYQAAYVGLAEVAFLMGDRDATYRYLETAIEKATSVQGALTARRGLAAAYLMHNDTQNAITNLQQVVQIATEREFDNIAATAHRQLAAIDAMRNVAAMTGHLNTAAELGGGADTPFNLWWTAMTYLLAGRTAEARSPAAALAGKVEDTPGWNTGSRQINAWIAIQDDNCTLAKNELVQADPTNPLIQALAGTCYKMGGMKPQAEQFRSKVLYNPQMNFFNPATPFIYLQARKI
jgi:tetratricopeptide (TPR) repeat protein